MVDPLARRRQRIRKQPIGVKSCNHTFDENETAEIQVLQFNISQRVADRLFPQPPLTQGFLKAAEKEKQDRLFSEVFRGQPRRRKVGTTSDTDASWACDSRKATAREERHARAVGYSLATNPYCS